MSERVSPMPRNEGTVMLETKTTRQKIAENTVLATLFLVDNAMNSLHGVIRAGFIVFWFLIFRFTLGVKLTVEEA